MFRIDWYIFTALHPNLDFVSRVRTWALNSNSRQACGKHLWRVGSESSDLRAPLIAQRKSDLRRPREKLTTGFTSEFGRSACLPKPQQLPTPGGVAKMVGGRGWDSNPRMEVLQFCGQRLNSSFSWAIPSVLTAPMGSFSRVLLATC